jgi:hypothetical protein
LSRCSLLLRSIIIEQANIGECVPNTKNEAILSPTAFQSQIFIADLMNSDPERLMVQSKRYFVAGVLVTSFYCVPVFQLIFGFHVVRKYSAF